jgi:hypothetical protein
VHNMITNVMFFKEVKVNHILESSEIKLFLMVDYQQRVQNIFLWVHKLKKTNFYFHICHVYSKIR